MFFRKTGVGQPCPSNYFGETIFTATQSRKKLDWHTPNNTIVIGRPGSGKSRYFYKPNLLNLQGNSTVVLDPKGEYYRDCGYALKQMGYTIKKLDLMNTEKSNYYNPFYNLSIYHDGTIYNCHNGQMIKHIDYLIDAIYLYTETEEDKSKDEFCKKTEMLFVRALMLYMMEHIHPNFQNFHTLLKLMRLSLSADGETCPMDKLIDEHEVLVHENEKYSENLGRSVLDWKLFRELITNFDTQQKIVQNAILRFSVFENNGLDKLTSYDSMELERIGQPLETEPSRLILPCRDGKVVWFIALDPTGSPKNILANLFLMQCFYMTEHVGRQYYGKVPTAVEFFLDEFAMVGTILNFTKHFCYDGKNNQHFYIGLNFLDQLEKLYHNENGILPKDYIMIEDCFKYYLMMPVSSANTVDKLYEIFTSQKQGCSENNISLEDLKNLKDGQCILYESFKEENNIIIDSLYDLEQHPKAYLLYEPWNVSLENIKKKME